jgi:hypothetical protein
MPIRRRISAVETLRTPHHLRYSSSSVELVRGPEPESGLCNLGHETVPSRQIVRSLEPFSALTSNLDRHKSQDFQADHKPDNQSEPSGIGDVLGMCCEFTEGMKSIVRNDLQTLLIRGSLQSREMVAG